MKDSQMIPTALKKMQNPEQPKQQEDDPAS